MAIVGSVARPCGQESDDPWLALLAGVVKVAVRDARAGRPDARLWLERDAAAVLDIFDIDHDRLQTALSRPAGRRQT